MENIIGKVNLNKELYILYKKAFCYILASRDIIRDDIDKIFDKDKIKFLNAFKSSDIRNSNIAKSYDVRTEIYNQKIIGILECDILQNNFKNIRILYSKAFKNTYRKLKDKKKIKLSDIVIASSDKDYTFSFAASIYFFYMIDKIYITMKKQYEWINEVANEIYVFENFKNIYFNNESFEKYGEELTYFRKKLNIKNKEYSLLELINITIANDLYNLGYIESKNNLKDIEINPGYQIVQEKGDYSKFIGVIEGYFNYLGYDTDNLAKIRFTKLEMNEIIMNLVLANRENNFTDIECISFFIGIIYSMALNKEYRKTREEYIKFVNEENIIKINKLNLDLEQCKSEVLNYKTKLKIKEKIITKSNNELLKQIEQLKKENQQFKKDLLKYESLRNEVIKLRNLSFTMLNNDKNKNDECEYDIDKLKTLNLAIVGGSNTWINKMKEKLPNIKFITNENRNNDIRFLKNMDMVFININMSHSLYFKLRTIIDKNNLKYNFIENKQNIEYSLMDLYKKVNEELNN